MPINFPKLNELGLSEKALAVARNFGGKPLAEYLGDTLKDLMVKIPAAKYFEPGILEKNYRDEAELLASVDFSEPLLARACVVADDETGHAGDLGLGTVIDLLPTKPVSSPEDFFSYLDDLSQLCKYGKPKSPPGRLIRDKGNIRDYYQYEGGNPEKLIKNVGVVLAKRSGDYAGAILEHPGEDGVYIIESRGERRESTDHYIFKKNKDGTIQQIAKGPYAITFNNYAPLIEAYEAIKKSELIPKERSFHMEFSFDSKSNKLYANQIKLFRNKYQPSSDWKLDPYKLFNDKPTAATTNDYAAFGITPSEGIEVNLYPVDKGLLEYEHSNVRGDDIAYAYSDSNSAGGTHQRPHFKFMPEEAMNSGIFHGTNAGCIAHGGHWIIANAGIGVWQNRLPVDLKLLDSNGELPARVRVKSDGIRARIEKISK